MFNANDALVEWWPLVKPGGYLLLTVPDEDLYEQGVFPSRFNSDHKATSRFRKSDSWSPVSLDLERMVSRLPGTRIISAELQSDNYDFSLQIKFGDRVGSSCLLTKVYLKLEKKLGACRTWGVESENRAQRGQVLPDLQTHSPAMGKKTVKNGPLRSICSRRFPSPTGS